MALTALLLVLAPLSSALIPPCLPELGPAFCTGTAQSTLRNLEDPPIQHIDSAPAIYPSISHESFLKEEVFSLLNKTDLEDSLRQFTLPERKPNRYCKSKFGVIAKDWISKAVQDVTQQNMSLPKGSALALSLRYIDNDTPQKSVVLRLLPPNADSKPGNTIVVGAHMDSVNHQRPQNQSDDSMIAPGADDNASGSIVLLNVVKALARVFEKKPMTNEVQFHWYGAEEIGLHGSKSVFSHMRNQSYNVKAMLNLDMVGYAGAHESGSPKIALQEGFVNRNLTAFMAKLVQTYTNAEPGYTSCGYPCSDHATAHQAGFPSAMIGESSYLQGNSGRPNGNPHIHSANDTIETLNFDYMLEFAKVAAAYVVELAYTDFEKLEKEGSL